MKIRTGILIKTAILMATAMAAVPAAASTDKAYAMLDRASSLACLRASGFRDARLAPLPLRFSDRLNVDARLVVGTYPQPHMKGAQGMALCLYDRRMKTAEVQDASPWLSRNSGGSAVTKKQ